jgi:hypothetical protein
MEQKSKSTPYRSERRSDTHADNGSRVRFDARGSQATDTRRTRGDERLRRVEISPVLLARLLKACE